MNKQILQAKHILESLSVPNIPDEIIKLQQELNVKYPNTVTIANLISHNPELLSDFLQLVNTNLTSQTETIKEAKAAVNLIGLTEIYNLYLSASISNMVAQSYYEREILKHDAQAGIAAAEMSYWVQDVTRSEAYMAGLLQNIGALYLSRYDESYLELFNQQNSNPYTKFKEEQSRYGTDHTLLTALVTKKWHVDDQVYKAIIYHHDKDFANKLGSDKKLLHLTALTMLANFTVASVMGETYVTQELKDYRKSALKQLDLPETALKAAVSAVKKWGSAVGLTSGSH